MPSTCPEPDASSLHLSRRALVGTGLATAALWRLGTAPALAARQDAISDPTTWHTWLLTSANELRPAAPSDPTSTEVAELLDYQSTRTDQTATDVAKWGSEAAVLPWDDLAAEVGVDIRGYALLRAALSDAVLAARDAQNAYHRDAPATADPRLTPMKGVATDRPSFPSEHAAVAGAASTVLAYLFPDEPADRFPTLAEEAASSRLWAGANYRSDIEAGLALGQAVGERAVARGKADGSDATWDGTGRPMGPGSWVPTPPEFVYPPEDPLGGRRQTWVLASGDAIRPAAPPAYDSSLWRAELGAVQQATAERTLEQERIIDYWRAKGPIGAFTGAARELMARERYDLPHTAYALAMVGVAMDDAVIAVWDAKYTWWTERPITADPDLAVYIPTPAYPSYPSGFSAVCGAAASVLADLFPAAAFDLLTAAAEGAAQRAWSGIHFVLDDDVGSMMGRQVGRLVAEIGRQNGAE
jgi:membrane-associated phospholipid phosphatase